MSTAYDAWIGRTEAATDVISLRQARQMAATLGVSADMHANDVLPPLWHWMGWQNDTPMGGLGPDGHPARGGFLPPVPLARRMWAGGRLTFHRPLSIGQPMQRQSEILKVAQKTGAAGDMVFVTLSHHIHGPDGLAVTEEQDIVYMAMPDQFSPPAPVLAADDPAWADTVAIDSVRLFRYSAITFNAHRIHFDLPYATGVEKYPGLVVHGPMQAMLLMAAACAHTPSRTVKSFSFRSVRPLFHFDALRLMGWPDQGDNTNLATVIDANITCMQAQIGWTR